MVLASGDYTKNLRVDNTEARTAEMFHDFVLEGHLEGLSHAAKGFQPKDDHITYVCSQLHPGATGNQLCSTAASSICSPCAMPALLPVGAWWLLTEFAIVLVRVCC